VVEEDGMGDCEVGVESEAKGPEGKDGRVEDRADVSEGRRVARERRTTACAAALQSCNGGRSCIRGQRGKDGEDEGEGAGVGMVMGEGKYD